MAFTTSQGGTQTELAEINMIPFIDIMLVLLIIFMITAPVIQTGIEVKVPPTQTVTELTEERLVVALDASRQLYLQNTPVQADELAEKIKNRNRSSKRPNSVYFAADESVPYGEAIAVLDRLKLGGIENVSLVTQPFEPLKPSASPPGRRRQ